MSARTPLHEDLVGMVIGKMMLVYGKRFTNSQCPDFTPQQVREHWALELSGVSEAGIRYALARLPVDRVPNVLEVRMLATNRPQDDYMALPAPQASPEVKQRGMQALAGLRDAFLRSGTHVDLRWAERIVANPAGRSLYSLRIATQVLRDHGRMK